jgi:LacI family transcriptional regulator
LIKVNPNLNSIFASTDLLAIGPVKEIKSTRRTIPEDTAVIGFSIWGLCKVCERLMSYMLQSGLKIGMKAAEIAIDSIGKPAAI